MHSTAGARRGRWAPLALSCLIVALAWASPAAAVMIETEGAVFAEKCLPCHARIAESRSSEIIFSHGYHIVLACSACHSQFPHRPEGTESPEMKECWYCHGLYHGPQGELATGQCDQCHRTAVDRLRPSWHTPNWADWPHVERGEDELRTTCMMCHDEAGCVDCHEDEDVVWIPGEPYTYDAVEGCLACHANENLIKTSQAGPKSYQVTGIEDSAHFDVTCQECHPDFKYEEGLDPTNLWAVNASFACMRCHEDDETLEALGETGDVTIVAEYRDSIHGQELAAGNYDTATCSSCHGGHYIQPLDTAAARAALHASGYRICARCHLEEWESYDDYYHGAAYKTGAPDAPSCWDCHDDHYILPSGDPESSMYDTNKPATCEGVLDSELNCHAGATEQFIESTSDMIHQRTETQEENPLRKFFSNIFGWLS